MDKSETHGRRNEILGIGVPRTVLGHLERLFTVDPSYTGWSRSMTDTLYHEANVISELNTAQDEFEFPTPLYNLVND